MNNLIFMANVIAAFAMVQAGPIVEADDSVLVENLAIGAIGLDSELWFHDVCYQAPCIHENRHQNFMAVVGVLVPEPGCLVMFTMGIVALGGYALRRRLQRSYCNQA